MISAVFYSTSYDALWKNAMPDVDNLLTSFYQLDDVARSEIVETVKLKLQYHHNLQRAEDIKQIKKW